MRGCAVVEAFGFGAILVREVPAVLSGASVRKLVQDVADALNEGRIAAAALDVLSV